MRTGLLEARILRPFTEIESSNGSVWLASDFQRRTLYILPRSGTGPEFVGVKITTRERFKEKGEACRNKAKGFEEVLKKIRYSVQRRVGVPCV